MFLELRPKRNFMDDVKNDVKNKTYNKKASEQNARKP